MDQARTQQEIDSNILKKQEQEMKEYNKQKVAETILQENTIKEQKVHSDDDLPFDDNSDEDQNYIDSTQAYDLWKIREILRLKRDRDEKLIHEQEQADILRRRNMTEEQRAAENELEGIGQKKQ